MKDKDFFVLAYETHKRLNAESSSRPLTPSPLFEGGGGAATHTTIICSVTTHTTIIF